MILMRCKAVVFGVQQVESVVTFGSGKRAAAGAMSCTISATAVRGLFFREEIRRLQSVPVQSIWVTVGGKTPAVMARQPGEPQVNDSHFTFGRCIRGLIESGSGQANPLTHTAGIGRSGVS